MIGPRLVAALVATAGLGGCATSDVLLLPGENGASAGAVAVIDEKSGNDSAVLAQANERARLSSGRISPRTVNPTRIPRRDRRLIEDLPPPPKHFTLNFQEDSTRLMADSAPVLVDLIAEVRRRDGVDVLVIGHTDRLGSAEDNDALSLKRAQQIREVLITQGLDPASTRAVGRGERDMLVATADGMRAAANRRVEVVVR
ncbi:OmpA family protein [Sphingomonas solaris]|uniref:OmpA family protein n=1 Tax=Alterirhizorhabdus solaris TaxID=2529389 RepID=A0A558QZT7_9SPHN|nr:OmpA family protein [Sphingomonas solaris]TVV72683.1 OmpA family protein [Sphingomonas solaris]